MGKKIGTKAVRDMVDYLMSACDAMVVCADPEENNRRSVRCRLKAGFTPVGKISNADSPGKNNIFMAVFR